MNSFGEFKAWCQAKLDQFRTNVKKAVSKEKSERIIGPCLTPETIPKFVIPESVSQVLARTSEEKNICGDEELVLNAGLPFHVHETKMTTSGDCLSKLELLKQSQFHACMSSRKIHENNHSSIYEVCDDNDAVYGTYTLKTCPQSVSFPEIEDIPSVYFGQLDRATTGSFYKKHVTEPHMSPLQQDFIEKAPMVLVNHMEADPLPRRQSSLRTSFYSRRRSSLPNCAAPLSARDRNDIRGELFSVCQSDKKGVAKGSHNAAHKTLSPSLSQGSRSPGSTKSINSKLRAKLGDLKFEFKYFRDTKQLKVLLLRGENVGGHKKSDYDMNAYVRLCLMPDKLQAQFSTVQRHTTDPHYNEEFYFSHIKLRDVQEMTLQLKIYNNIPRRPTETIGTISVPLFKYDILEVNRLWMAIEKTTSRMYDIGHISLSVNLNTSHKKLLVAIGRVTGLGSANKPDGTYVTVDVSQQFGDATQQRTRDQENSSYPVFNETLAFELPLVTLDDLMAISIIVSVFNVDLLGHDIMLGQVCLGCDSTEDSEKLHWQEVLQRQGQTVGKWHYLMEQI